MRRKMLKIALGVIVLLAVSGVVVRQILRDRPGEKMREAMELRNNGQVEEAADLFGKISMIYPGSPHAPNALFEMGFTYYVIAFPKAPDSEKGIKIKLAQYALEKMIEQYPESPLVEKARLYLGEIYSSVGEDAKALENYEAAEMLVDDPNQLQEIYHQMAVSYERLGHYERAIERLKQIIDLGIKGRYRENSFIRLAFYYRMAAAESDDRTNEYDEMIVNLLIRLLTEEKDISHTSRQEALMALTHSLLELKRFEEAAASLQQVKVTPTNRALIDDYSERLRRQSTMGRN